MSNFPVYGVPFTFYVTLESGSQTGKIVTNPTLTAGDVVISKDGGAEANLATLPTVTPAGGKHVQVSLSAAEMTADDVSIIFSDPDNEWTDLHIHIQPQRIPFATVDASTYTPTVSSFETDLTEATSDHYKDLFVYFLTGANSGLSRKIGTYDGTNKRISVSTPLPDPPANGDQFLILGRSE